MECISDTAEATEDSGLEGKVAEGEGREEVRENVADASTRSQDNRHSNHKKNSKNNNHSDRSGKTEESSPKKTYSKRSGNEPESYILPKRQYNSGRGQINSAKSSKSSGIEEKLTRNPIHVSKVSDNSYDDIARGSSVIFWYECPEDGKIYFVWELKTGHPDPKSRDKYALIGETAKVGEHSATETIVRGLKEEDPDSYKVLLQALIDNGYKFGEIRSRVEGRPSTVTIYTAQIIGSKNIEQVNHSKLTEGQKVISSLEETVELLNRGSFAYGDKIIMEFILTNFHKFFEYKPQLYASDISFKNNPLPLAIPLHANIYKLNLN